MIELAHAETTALEAVADAVEVDGCSQTDFALFNQFNDFVRDAAPRASNKVSQAGAAIEALAAHAFIVSGRQSIAAYCVSIFVIHLRCRASPFPPCRQFSCRMIPQPSLASLAASQSRMVAPPLPLRRRVEQLEPGSPLEGLRLMMSSTSWVSHPQPLSVLDHVRPSVRVPTRVSMQASNSPFCTRAYRVRMHHNDTQNETAPVMILHYSPSTAAAGLRSS